MEPLRADRSTQKMRNICNVLRLINAKRAFARTYTGIKDPAYEEIQDEIVLLLERAGKVFSFEWN